MSRLPPSVIATLHLRWENWQLTALHIAGGEKILPDDYGFNMRFEDGRIEGYSPTPF